jgi:predicted PurR-regulated permease PerM
VTIPLPIPPSPSQERRRIERRTNGRIADLALPELRRILLTTLLAVMVVGLFLWMVREVLIAGILGVLLAAYLRPMYLRLVNGPIRSPRNAALVTIFAVLLPILGALAYSYMEVLDVVRYLSSHQQEVADRISASLRRLVFLENLSQQTIREHVLRVSAYGAALPAVLQEAIVEFSVAATIFLFTTFYIFTEGTEVMAYVRSKVPPRYAELTGALDRNVRGVLYGAIYSTLLTQTLKSVVIFVMCLVFRVPLAGVLAILSFIIGFFPIVGSWSVYVPVAAWLLVFRDSPVSALIVLAIGFGLNTVFISTFLRPKLAAERSRVLNFYWMFVGLVTGVYTFGLAGILLGPILIGLLKAVVDTVTAGSSWRLLETEGVGDDAQGDEAPPGAAPA